MPKLQQVMIFTLYEFNKLNNKNPYLIDKLRFASLETKKKEGNFLCERLIVLVLVLIIFINLFCSQNKKILLLIY